jgi:transketolase
MSKWMSGWKLGLPTRKAYGQALVGLGRKDSRIVAFEGDMAHSTFSNLFEQEFPDRYFQIGIAESNMIGMAVGMSLCGKIPFCSTFSSFMLTKSFDQARVSVAYSKVPVKIVGSHSGISSGQDGPTQQGIEDVGLALLLPGFEIIVPSDEVQMRAAIEAIAYRPSPAYIRTSRPPSPIIYEDGIDYVVGKAIKLRDGKDVTLIANGLMVALALDAAKLLEKNGLSTRVLDMHTVRPLDEDAIKDAVKDTGALVVVEEHLIYSGLGSQVSMFVTQNCLAPVQIVGLSWYAESGEPEELFEKYELTAEKIYNSALVAISKK